MVRSAAVVRVALLSTLLLAGGAALGAGKAEAQGYYVAPQGYYVVPPPAYYYPPYRYYAASPRYYHPRAWYGWRHDVHRDRHGWDQRRDPRHR